MSDESTAVADPALDASDPAADGADSTPAAAPAAPQTAEQYLDSPERANAILGALGVPPTPADSDPAEPTGAALKPAKFVKVDPHGDGRIFEVPSLVAKRLAFVEKELKAERARARSAAQSAPQAQPAQPQPAASQPAPQAQPPADQAPAQDLNSWAASVGIPLPSQYDDASFSSALEEADQFLGAQGKITALFTALDKRIASRGYVDGSTLLSKIAVPLAEVVNAQRTRLDQVPPPLAPARDRALIAETVASLDYQDVPGFDADSLAPRIASLRDRLVQEGQPKEHLDGPQFMNYAVLRVIADINRERLARANGAGHAGEEEKYNPPSTLAPSSTSRRVAPHSPPARMSGAERTRPNGSANRQPISIDPGKALRTFLTTGQIPA